VTSVVSARRWWAGKVRQFGRHVFGRVGAAERQALEAWLSPAQLALFGRMHRADQRHGLDVVAALRGQGHSDPELLLAGLLHDCGKGRSVGLWHRVGWSLGERYGARVRRLWLVLPGFRRAFEDLDQHAARSAELCLEAGCSPRVAELVHNQAEPTDDLLGEALRLADEAS
jgi:hypothetical protein